MAPCVAFWVDRHNCVNKSDVPQLKFHPGAHFDYDFHMQFRCAFFAVLIRAGYTRILHFLAFQQTQNLKARTMDYKWQSSHRYGTNNMPAVFPRKDNRTAQVVWPVDISYLLNAEEATVSMSNNTEKADVVCSSCEQVESEQAITSQRI